MKKTYGINFINNYYHSQYHESIGLFIVIKFLIRHQQLSTSIVELLLIPLSHYMYILVSSITIIFTKISTAYCNVIKIGEQKILFSTHSASHLIKWFHYIGNDTLIFFSFIVAKETMCFRINSIIFIKCQL